MHELSEPYDIGDLPLDESSNLIIAQLPSTGNSHAEVDSNLKKNGKIVLVTTLHPACNELGYNDVDVFAAKSLTTTLKSSAQRTPSCNEQFLCFILLITGRNEVLAKVIFL